MFQKKHEKKFQTTASSPTTFKHKFDFIIFLFLLYDTYIFAPSQNQINIHHIICYFTFFHSSFILQLDIFVCLRDIPCRGVKEKRRREAKKGNFPIIWFYCYYSSGFDKWENYFNCSDFYVFFVCYFHFYSGYIASGLTLFHSCLICNLH